MANFHFGVAALVFQVMLIVFFGVFTEYNKNLGPGSEADNECLQRTQVTCTPANGCQWDSDASECRVLDTGLDADAPLFESLQGGVIVGFGLLATFLYRYGYSAAGLNLLLASLAIQWHVFTDAFWHRAFFGDWNTYIPFDFSSVVNGTFAAMAVSVSVGAILGKVTPLQLLVIVFFELIFYSLNLVLCEREMQAVDYGRSMYVHIFGAYFGLTLSMFVGATERDSSARHLDNRSNVSNRTSSLFTMVGALFLWIFFPSINGILVTGAARHRAIINTVLCLAGSTSGAFATSNILRPHNKFGVEDIHHAALAGGVAAGTTAALELLPYGATLLGLAAGIVAVVGYIFITPYLESRINLHDTAGIHNLHGMPGLMGGIVGAIVATQAGTEEYYNSLTTLFPAFNGSRTAIDQGGYQAAATFISMGIGIGGAAVVGCIIRWLLPAVQHPFEDSEFWLIEEADAEGGSSKPAGKRNRVGSVSAFDTAAL